MHSWSRISDFSESTGRTYHLKSRGLGLCTNDYLPLLSPRNVNYLFTRTFTQNATSTSATSSWMSPRIVGYLVRLHQCTSMYSSCGTFKFNGSADLPNFELAGKKDSSYSSSSQAWGLFFYPIKPIPSVGHLTLSWLGVIGCGLLTWEPGGSF